MHGSNDEHSPQENDDVVQFQPSKGLVQFQIVGS